MLDAVVVNTCVLWNFRFVILELDAPWLNSIHVGSKDGRLYPYIVFKSSVKPFPFMFIGLSTV